MYGDLHGLSLSVEREKIMESPCPRVCKARLQDNEIKTRYRILFSL